MEPNLDEIWQAFITIHNNLSGGKGKKLSLPHKVLYYWWIDFKEVMAQFELIYHIEKNEQEDNSKD